MTFLQPFILWGLPLILLPVIIHLLNRMRHRSVQWAAMMFLRAASRKSTRYARLRQWLVLLFRVLAVLLLVLALSRPLAGGWLGWMFAPAPDVILILLDRSASMELRGPGGTLTKRELALNLIGDAAGSFAGTSRFVLIDSATQSPGEIDAISALPELASVAPTETAADLPALVQTAVDWINRNRPGSTDLWIASDLQASNWTPESDRWNALNAALEELPQRVRIRLLALPAEADDNRNLSLTRVRRLETARGSELELDMEIRRGTETSDRLPLTLTLNQGRSQIDLAAEGRLFRHRHVVPLETREGGWGSVGLPADANDRDNTAWFAFGPPPILRTAIVSEDPLAGRYLALAAAPDPNDTNRVARPIPPDQLASVLWDEHALVLWQGTLPKDDVAARLEDYVSSGGIVLFFPGDETGSGSFLGNGWGEDSRAEDEDTLFSVQQWDQQDGPLARTDEGLSLPMERLEVTRRRAINGEHTLLATFQDDPPFLTRTATGDGQAYFCATVPHPDWSRLQDGPVLVPLVQRLLQAGGARLAEVEFVACGDWDPSATPDAWIAVDSETRRDPATQAGVYRAGGRLIAVNRPAREDLPGTLEPAEIETLLDGVSLQLFEETQQGGDALQSELWRAFLFVMGIFLMVEAFLVLPERGGRRPIPMTLAPDDTPGEPEKELAA
jgi:hypothetical protein